MSLNSKLYNKLKSIEALKPLLSVARFGGKKIVFTNGVFDILHTGHVDYLSKARDFGDILVLGLNTDSSVKRLNKGPERPINSEKARATVLGALECVDYIVLFDEDTPYELIKALHPDVLVKGADYAPESIVGYDIVKARGGEVKTVELSAGFSTTNIIKKINEGKQLIGSLSLFKSSFSMKLLDLINPSTFSKIPQRSSPPHQMPLPGVHSK